MHDKRYIIIVLIIISESDNLEYYIDPDNIGYISYYANGEREFYDKGIGVVNSVVYINIFTNRTEQNDVSRNCVAGCLVVPLHSLIFTIGTYFSVRAEDCLISSNNQFLIIISFMRLIASGDRKTLVLIQKFASEILENSRLELNTGFVFDKSVIQDYLTSRGVILAILNLFSPDELDKVSRDISFLN